MVLWGAVWGAVLGLLWPGRLEEFQLVAGAVLGAIAGLTLRRSVRKEWARQQAAAPAAPATAAAQAAPRAITAPAPTAAPVAAHPAEAVNTAPPARPLPNPVPIVPRPPPGPPQPTALDLPATLLMRGWNWLWGGNTVVRMGVVVLFIGLAFLARFAVENALLPPQVRLAGIGIAGIALFVFGLRMRGRADRVGYATTLQGAGIAVLYLTVFAAFRLYQFLPAGAAFVALGLVCLFSTAIALALNAQALAFIGFAGGFAAPVLVSTGQGDAAGLFGYYLLLGVAIACIAWKKAWRPLNLLGFIATFGVATAWGVLRYQPSDYATIQPFLAGFFAVYLLASLFYALRHGQPARKAVDATLVFGTPIVAFGLQVGLVRDIPYAAAFSALALGLVYVLLGAWLLRGRGGDATVRRWLAECFLALALGFVTLAIPLALDGRWTSAAWAVEGAAVYWMGLRQGRWLARACALALQAVAAGLYLDASTAGASGHWPFANPAFLGAALLAASALAIAWWSRDPVRPAQEGALATLFGALESAVSPILFWIGVLWSQAALGVEIDRRVLDAAGNAAPLFGPAQQQMLYLLAWVVSAFALHHLALSRRARPWAIAATPAWLVLPVMLGIALWGMEGRGHIFQGGGWLAWPLAIALHLRMLRRLDDAAPRGWWPWVHAGGVWLLVLLAGNLLLFAIGQAQLWRTAWAAVLLLVAGSVVLLALVFACRHALRGADAPRWPLDRFTRSYAWHAAAPLAVALAAGALLVAISSRGEARPLPYVPLLNPTDLAVALALATCTLWLLRMRRSVLELPAVVHGPVPAGTLAAIAFVAVNTVWLRVAHHWGGVPWDAGALFGSFVVQTGYSILWTLIALALMVLAHRRALRTPWMGGAALLGLTVLKLFVVDLSNSGGSERIVAFIAVGLLMLVVGWLAPLPPARREPSRAAQDLREATP